MTQSRPFTAAETLGQQKIIDQARQAQTPALIENGFQYMAIEGTVPWRYVVNFRMDKRLFTPYLPDPLRLDTFQGGALLSVCILKIEHMGPPLAPPIFRFATHELLYRVAVVIPATGADKDRCEKRSFLTIGSLVSSPVMAYLGRRWSHYRPQRAHFCVLEKAGMIDMAITEPSGHQVRFRSDLPRTQHSPHLNSVSEFVLGVEGSVSVDQRQRVRFQRISHPPWMVTPCKSPDAELWGTSLLEGFGCSLGSRMTFDSMFHIATDQPLWHPMTILQ